MVGTSYPQGLGNDDPAITIKKIKSDPI